jgi:hypothetical protein
MSTLHETAQALHETTEAPHPADALALLYESGEGIVDGQTVRGYLLYSPGNRAVAFIQTLAGQRPDPRIGAHLARIMRSRTLPARMIVRALLGAEDYMSTMYDNIVRVHYAGEFTVPGNQADQYARAATRAVGYEGGRDAFRPVGKMPELAMGYETAGLLDWRRDAYETFDGKRYRK